eukprot:XP_017451540.1 PREDICTED: uncharacterized protein LOC108351723 isoform X1 [Rattus norvegicus]
MAARPSTAASRPPVLEKRLGREVAEEKRRRALNSSHAPNSQQSGPTRSPRGPRATIDRNIPDSRAKTYCEAAHLLLPSIIFSIQMRVVGARTRVRSPSSLRPERVRPAGPPLGAHSHAHPRTHTRTRGSTRTGSQSHTKGSSDGGRNMLRWHCTPPPPPSNLAIHLHSDPKPHISPEPPSIKKCLPPKHTFTHNTK